MCMMIYLAAEKPLRTIAWVDAAPAFYVSAIAPDEDRVRRQFSADHVVYAGSYEGCGCGFQLGVNDTAVLDPEELVQRRESLRAFASYLREEQRRAGDIRLFACWDGDQDEPPEHHRRLTPSDLESEPFAFLQRELSMIARE